jgi:hypothetical protein
MITNHRPTQKDTDISVPRPLDIARDRLAGLKESSRFRVRNPLIWNLSKGSPFCFAIVGKAKSLRLSRERSERVANNGLSPIRCKASLSPSSG